MRPHVHRLGDTILKCIYAALQRQLLGCLHTVVKLFTVHTGSALKDVRHLIINMTWYGGLRLFMLPL